MIIIRSEKWGKNIQATAYNGSRKVTGILSFKHCTDVLPNCSVPPLRAKMALREFLFHKIQTLVKRKSPDLNQPEKLPHQMEISKSPPATKSFFPLFRRRLRRKNSNESGDLVKAHNQMTKTKHVFFLYAGINIQKLFVMLKLLASFFDPTMEDLL